MTTHPRPMLDMRADMYKDVVSPLVALLAARDIAPVLVQHLAPRAQPSREALQKALVQIRALVTRPVVVRTTPELLQSDAGVRVQDGAERRAWCWCLYRSQWPRLHLRKRWRGSEGIGHRLFIGIVRITKCMRCPGVFRLRNGQVG